MAFESVVNTGSVELMSVAVGIMEGMHMCTYLCGTADDPESYRQGNQGWRHSRAVGLGPPLPPVEDNPGLTVSDPT